jgi:hypothetical protein
MANNRYAGISPFTSEQRDVFFGREKDIEELYEQILLDKQVLLYAKSGIGKSSIVNAGVLPKLEEANEYKAIKIRFKSYDERNIEKPIQRIYSEINNIIASGQNKETILEQIIAGERESLWYYFKKIQLINSDLKLILVFDQFEELFTYPDEDITEFKNQFSELLKSEVPVRFVELFAKFRNNNRDLMDRQTMSLLNKSVVIKAVYIIRSDRLSELNRLRDRIPDIQKSYYELFSLDKNQARDAIVNPALKEGDFESPKFDFEEDALEKILKYLTNNYTQDVETTQLQIICQRIEANRTSLAQGKVKASDIPNFKNIFFDFYHDAISVVSQNERENARKLVEDELIRNQQRISLDGRICADYLPELELQKLVNTHLLRAERNTVGGFSYELSHDTLIEPIYEAAQNRRQKEEEERAEAEHFEQLRAANEIAEKERIEREKERKRQRQIIIIVSIAAVISIAFGIFGFVNMRKAQANIVRLIAKDAISFENEERYIAAKGKYEQLLAYSDTTDGIRKRIKDCIYLDSVSKIFNTKVKIIDSLIKSEDINDLKNVDNEFVQIRALHYKPGKAKLQTLWNTHQLQINNWVNDRLRLAGDMIGSPDLRGDVIDLIKELEQLSPDNPKIIEFKKTNNL